MLFRQVNNFIAAPPRFFRPTKDGGIAPKISTAIGKAQLFRK